MERVWVQSGVIGIILLFTYHVVTTDEIRDVRWPAVVGVGFIAGAGIALPCQFAFDSPMRGTTPARVIDEMQPDKTNAPASSTSTSTRRQRAHRAEGVQSHHHCH